MNIHKYVIPASLAATVHVALLMLTTDPGTVIIEVPLESPPLKPIPKVPEDPIALPPEDRPVSVEQVKPSLGKPAPPSIDEPPPMRIPDGAITIPVDNRSRPFDPSINRLPDKIGSEAGVPDGIDLSRVPVFGPGMLDNAPRAKVQIPPDYPFAMKQNGTSGTVMVRFDVDPAGRVIRAEAVSYTMREFAEPAVRAVQKWRFEPGRRNGKPVPFRMTIPIEFSIENER